MPTQALDTSASYSLGDICDSYGFYTPQQQEAFGNLLEQAGILSGDNCWQKVFLTKKTEDELLLDILKLLQETQLKFWGRHDGDGKQPLERWEVKSLKWMEANVEEILKELEKLGFIKEISEPMNHSDALCILGTQALLMKERIQYAEYLMRTGLKIKEIIFLTGERNVTECIDGTRQELKKIAQSYQISDWKKLTETDLARSLYNSSELWAYKLPCHIINTPKIGLIRPTTQTSIMKLIPWLYRHPHLKRIIFISNQPYIKYQSALIYSLFKYHDIDIKIHVIGPSSPTYFKTKEILEGLGSYIWAITPSVLSHMRLSTNNQTIKEEFEKLYSKRSLIYNALPTSLKV